MVGHAAGNGGRGFNHIEPVHGRLLLAHASLVAELARVAYGCRSRTQKIGAQGEDDVGLLEAVNRIDILAKGQQRAPAHVIGVDGFVLMPLGLRELF